MADGVANIRVAQCNGNIWGAVAWEKTPGGKDTNNPDASKQSRPTLGMPILIDMKKKAGVDAWEGQVYNAKDGQTLQLDHQASWYRPARDSGCVLGFLCGGETWTRVGPPISSSPVNSMAKGAPKSHRCLAEDRRTGNRAAAPKTTGSANRAARQGRARSEAGAAQPADPVGDICLLPDIARFAH